MFHVTADFTPLSMVTKMRDAKKKKKLQHLTNKHLI